MIILYGIARTGKCIETDSTQLFYDSNIPPLLFVCVWYQGMHAHVCTCVYGGQRLVLAVFLSYHLKQGLSLSLELKDGTRLAGQ